MGHAEALEQALADGGPFEAVFIVSPTYYGMAADSPAAPRWRIAPVCR